MEDAPELGSVAAEYIRLLRAAAVPWLRECETRARRLGDEFSAAVWRDLAEAAERAAASKPGQDD
jgi:hypothetical protein